MIYPQANQVECTSGTDNRQCLSIDGSCDGNEVFLLHNLASLPTKLVMANTISIQIINNRTAIMNEA